MWNSYPLLSLLETMGEGRVAPYAAMWVGVVCACVGMCVRGGLSLCAHMCPSG